MTIHRHIIATVKIRSTSAEAFAETANTIWPKPEWATPQKIVSGPGWTCVRGITPGWLTPPTIDPETGDTIEPGERRSGYLADIAVYEPELLPWLEEQLRAIGELDHVVDPISEFTRHGFA